MVWCAARSRAPRRCPRNSTGLPAKNCTNACAAPALRSSKTASRATPSPSKPCEPKPTRRLGAGGAPDALKTAARRTLRGCVVFQTALPRAAARSLADPAWRAALPPHPAEILALQNPVIAVASEAWLKEIKRHQRPVHARIRRLLPWPVDALEFVVENLPAPPRPDSLSAPETSAPLNPLTPDSLDLSTQDSLARLDDTTRDIMLRIRAHIDAENGPSTD